MKTIPAYKFTALFNAIAPFRCGLSGILLAIFCMGLAWGATTASSPTTPHFPASRQLQYEVIGRSKGFPYRAQARLDWKNEGQRYQAQMTMTAFLLGSRVQTSTGQLLSTGLQPTHFVDQARQKREVIFDRRAQQATDVSKALTVTATADVQDKLSILLQLGWQLSRHSSATVASDSQWTWQVMGPHGVEEWVFEWRGIETIQLQNGTLDTWHLQRRGATPHEVSLQVWLAPELDWLPVRLVLQQATGDQVEQTLQMLPPHHPR